MAETIHAATGGETNLVFGVSVRPDLRDELQVTVVATGTGVADVTPAMVTAPPPAVERPTRADARADAEDRDRGCRHKGSGDSHAADLRPRRSRCRRRRQRSPLPK